MKDLLWISGTKFAYNQENKLGEGYGGTIYQGINKANLEQIAVKVLNHNFRVETQISCSEIKQIAKTNFCIQQNPYATKNPLVEIIDIIQLDKTYMIMQLCKCNLKQYFLSQKKFRENQVLKILKQVVQGLIKVEKHGYHFCDLKPENILITKENQAKLGDLQSIIKLNDLGQIKKKFRKQIFGTLHYMPPELTQFGEYGKENYIWTLGVILHEMIYHRPPFNIINWNQNPPENNNKHYNLNVCTDYEDEYPKCHQLLKSMLRLNGRKRISLQKLYEFLSESSTQTENHSFNSDGNSQTKSRPEQSMRKNSQTTEDSFVIEEDEILNSSQLTKSNQQIQQNQKQSSNRLFHSQNLSTPKILSKQSLEENGTNQLIPSQFFNETFMLIDKIQSPLILVKKLNQLKLSLKNILSFNNGQIAKNSKAQNCGKIQNCLKTIKESKAFSHLQKTFKYSTSQKDKQLNSKELILWEHLDNLFQSSKQID